LGQPLFNAPNVSGWGDGLDWITSEKLLARIEWLEQYATKICAASKTNANCQFFALFDHLSRSNLKNDRLDSLDLKKPAMANRMESKIATSVEDNPTTIVGNQSSRILQIKNVVLASVVNPNPEINRNPHITFALQGVKYKDREWHNIHFTIRNSLDGLLLELDSNGCFPDCFHKWPSCSKTRENEPNYIVSTFELGKNGKNCLFQLESVDLELVQSFLQNLLSIYENVSTSRRAQSKNRLQSFDAWEKHLQAIDRDVNLDNKHKHTLISINSNSPLTKRKRYYFPAMPLIASRDNSATREAANGLFEKMINRKQSLLELFH